MNLEEIDTLRMDLGVVDTDMPIDFPLRRGGRWCVDVDLRTGTIKNWTGGEAQLYLKVCDDGNYTLLAGDRVVVTFQEEYVPNRLVPGCFGDYVDLSIEPDGKITNWPSQTIDLTDFEWWIRDGRGVFGGAA